MQDTLNRTIHIGFSLKGRGGEGKGALRFFKVWCRRVVSTGSESRGEVVVVEGQDGPTRRDRHAPGWNRFKLPFCVVALTRIGLCLPPPSQNQ